MYEVNQDSEWYMEKQKERANTKAFFKEINSEYFIDNGFSFYHSEHFGVNGDSKDYETYKNELAKNPDKNNVHIFKKRTPHFKIFKEMLKKIEIVSPFHPHDVFGLNNVSSSQWIGDRWFFEVKHEKYIKKKDMVTPIDYKDYLNLVLEAMK